MNERKLNTLHEQIAKGVTSLVSVNGLTLEHDSQGQLGGANGDVGLGYDYRRLRVGESVYYDDEDWETLSFTYDARGNLLDRYDDWMYDEFQYVYADGIDEVVLERSGDYYGMEVYALVTDHLGSVVRRFNPDGSLSVGGEYHPFGDPPVLLGDVSGRLWFTGREYDRETGLYYYRNRWYSTELGRFLEPDPIGLQAKDVNLYRYVRNRPLSFTDALGLDEYWITLPLVPGPKGSEIGGTVGIDTDPYAPKLTLSPEISKGLGEWGPWVSWPPGEAGWCEFRVKPGDELVIATPKFSFKWKAASDKSPKSPISKLFIWLCKLWGCSEDKLKKFTDIFG